MPALFRRAAGPSTTSVAPSDSDANAHDFIELGTFGSPSASNASLPTYADATGEGTSFGELGEARAFVATQKLRIETPGKPLLGLPLPPQPDPIPIYDVTSNICPVVPLYVSVRPTRGSGTCHLVKGDDPTETPLCTTTYRFGPGKPPVISLHKRHQSSDAEPSVTRSSSEDEEVQQETIDSPFTSPHVFHRTQLLRSMQGTFTWRYASKSERKPVSADSLLLFERVVKVALPGGKSEERRTPIARFLRNAETRTEGSTRSTAGNGGLLEMDLRDWADSKSDIEQMRLLVVSTCVSMLKKEVDRRRMHQMMAIMGAVSGGGP